VQALAQLLQQLDAAHFGQIPVEQQRIEALMLESVQQVCAVLKRADVMASDSQPMGQ
jgi:hypothetical protein